MTCSLHLFPHLWNGLCASFCGFVSKVWQIVFSKGDRGIFSHAMISRMYPLPYPEGESNLPSLESGQTCDLPATQGMWCRWIGTPLECRAQMEMRHSHLDPEEEVQISRGCHATRQLKQPCGESHGEVVTIKKPSWGPHHRPAFTISHVREPFPITLTLHKQLLWVFQPSQWTPEAPWDRDESSLVPCPASSPTLSESKEKWLSYATKFGVICCVAILIGKGCSGDKIPIEQVARGRTVLIIYTIFFSRLDLRYDRRW